MSFSFNEATSTHPNPTPTEETTDVTQPDAATTDAAADTPDAVPPVGDSEVPTDAAEPTPEGDGEGDNPPDGESQPDGSEAAPGVGECYFGDTAVEIDIPQDVSDALKEHGIDAVAVANELYAKGGEFKLSPETREKLDKAFGKFAVDAYLGGLKAQNEGFLNQLTRDAEAAEKADGERFEAVAKEVGGADGWATLERFALETLSDEELTGFNEVMKSGNQYLQMYAVRELETRRKAAQGDDKVTLVDATSAASDASNGPLSGQDYIREISQLGKKYGNDRVARAAAEKALDARRMAGMKAGL